MKIFLCYLRERRGRILLTFACFALLLASFILFHLPLETALYPLFLCMLILLCAAVHDYGVYLEKHKTLTQLASLPDTITQELSEYDGLHDREYGEIIARYNELLREEREKTERRRTDMVDYYTTWVHQIKTPIASMYLALQEDDTPAARQLLGELQRIEQYVEMVMTYLRLDSESTDYVFRKTPLDPVIKASVRKLSGWFIGRGLRLVYSGTNAAVITDEKWLSFVLEQVLTNAAKYTRSGSITITVEENGTVTVTDTGIGIAPEDLPRIFEKGYTGYNGRIDKKASGLGLYLCRRICTALGHEISASSVPGKGTSVRIEFPAEKPQPE